MLFHAHSGLRYAVLAAGVIALVVLRTGQFRNRPYGRAGRIAGLVFIGLLDLQVLLGLVNVVVRPWLPALIGHIALMVLALVTAHALAVASRRATADSRRYTLAELGVVLPLILIVGGIAALGRAVL